MTIRQSYALLDYVGDVGGLIDGLNYLFAFLFAPFWKFKFSTQMLTSLFRDGPGPDHNPLKTQTYNTKSDRLS